MCGLVWLTGGRSRHRFAINHCAISCGTSRLRLTNSSTPLRGVQPPAERALLDRARTWRGPVNQSSSQRGDQGRAGEPDHTRMGSGPGKALDSGRMGWPPYTGLSILVHRVHLLLCGSHSRLLRMLVLNLVEAGMRLTGLTGQARGQRRLASVRPAHTVAGSQAPPPE